MLIRLTAAPAADGWTEAVTAAFAEEWDLPTIADLANVTVPLTVGGNAELEQRHGLVPEPGEVAVVDLEVVMPLPDAGAGLDKAGLTPEQRVLPDPPKGKTRLEAEIRLIESWMAQLEGTRPDNTEMLAARKNYMDMLQSRRDLLQSLQRHRPA